MLVSDMKGLRQGKLRLAVVTTAKYFAPRLLGPFCKLYPGIDVSLKVSNLERLLERLTENRDDLYVLGQPPEGLDVVYEPFLDNPLLVLSRHTLALDVAMGQLATLDVEHFPIERQWYAVYLAGKQPSTVARTFLEYLRSAAEQVKDIPCHFAEQAGRCPRLINS